MIVALQRKNDCYGLAPITPKGIIVHSTGSNNPNLSRYIVAEDGSLGVNIYHNDWNRPGTNKAVHAFIGKLPDGRVAVAQALPFNQCCWGCGRGKKGSYNYSPTGYIQFEICEDALNDIQYFNAVFTEAAHFCAYLMAIYDIPLDNVISHHEAYLRGYASNHSDCDHWLKKFGKNMDWFRDLVRSAYYADKKEVIKEPVKEYTKALMGEGLIKIAKRAGITLAQIKALNPEIKPPLYIVRLGQEVRVK